MNENLFRFARLLYSRESAAALAGMLASGALLLAAGSGCSSGELPPGFGESTPVESETPESFELAWQTFDQVTLFNLVRSRPRSDSPEEPEVDPLVSGDPKKAQPHELVYAKKISLPVARERVVSHLNNWIASLHGDDDWQRDPLLDRLPSYLQDNPTLRTLGDLHFHLEDFDYLQQCLWLRDISSWGAASEPGPLTGRTIAQAKASLAGDDKSGDGISGDDISSDGISSDDARQLAATIMLFDWTVRNIQLDPLLPEQRDVTAGPGGGGRRALAAEMGIPGPGYMATPGQVLLFGHGDAWQRARVFILLLRQTGVDAVMLAFQDTGPAEKHKPWLPAAHIGGKLYLFEPALGLPVPGPEGKGVATLDQLLEQPELLRQLDVDDGGEKLTYPVQADELTALVALLDAEPAALCRRMEMVERNLSGRRKMVLTVSPSRIAEKVGKCPGVKFVRPWSVPLEAPLFVAARQQIAIDALGRLSRGQQVPEGQLALLGEVEYESQVFGDMTPVCAGRYDQLHGKFDKQGDDRGATEWLLQTLQPESTLSRLDVSSRAWRELGVDPAQIEKMDEAAKKALAEQTAARLRSINRQARLWLGQTTYENGDFGTSINWLQRVDDSEDNPWRYAAHYNMARAYEVQGEIDEARRIYLLDDSPQKQGNRLRARMLRGLQVKKNGPG